VVWNPRIHGGWLHRGRQLVCGCRLHDRLPLLPIAYGAAVVIARSLPCRVGSVHQRQPMGACRVACHSDCPACEHQPKTPAAFFLLVLSGTFSSYPIS